MKASNFLASCYAKNGPSLCTFNFFLCRIAESCDEPGSLPLKWMQFEYTKTSSAAFISNRVIAMSPHKVA